MIDNTDLKILALLEDNSRISYTNISKEVNLSIPSVIERINRLTKNQVIVKNTVEINYKALGLNFHAIICIDVKDNLLAEFESFCSNSRNVICYDRVVGSYNCIIKVAVDNTEKLQILLDSIKIYGTTKTCILTGSSFKNKIHNIISSEENYNSFDKKK